MYQPHRIMSFLFFFMGLYSLSAHALRDDHFKKVVIFADSGIYNYKTGINVYKGHVKIDQGTTHVTADRLITKNNDKHVIEEVIAYGDKTLAHYWTLTKVGDPEMHAQAKVIKYYPIESNVTLENNAFVSQGENNFQGQLIHYNSKEQTITMPAAESGHAILIYNPDK